MGKLLDLAGKDFGLLHVIRRVEDRKPGRPMWLCICDCGRSVVVSSTNLTKAGGTQSCGCLRHLPSPTFIDLTGQQFGKLVVVERDTDKNNKTHWICKCECGNTVSVASYDLRSGKSKSCGCSQRKLKHDLTGQEFGYLKVVERVYNNRISSNETRWSCLCQNCGRTVEVASHHLRTSNPYGHCRCTRFEQV